MRGRSDPRVDLSHFAELHRLRAQRDECGDPHVPGKDGQVYQYSDAQLAVMVLDSTPRKWGHKKRIGQAAGMTLVADGDFEGALTFDPSDEEQATVAIRIAGIRPKRRLSDETLARLINAGRAHRFSSERDGDRKGFYDAEDPGGEGGDYRTVRLGNQTGIR